MRVATVSKRYSVTFWRAGVTLAHLKRDTFDTWQKSRSQQGEGGSRDKPAMARPVPL